jgi:hypothetical protein
VLFSYLFFDLIVSISWWHNTYPFHMYVRFVFLIQVRGDDKDDPTTYLVTFDEEEGAKYLVTCYVHSQLYLYLRMVLGT